MADSNAQIIELQRRLTAAEEAAKREEAKTASQLQSTEAELARLRQCLSAESSPDTARSSISPPSPSEQPQPRADVEARVFELEARIRQLNDSLLTKQDSLEATLAQNHALKVSFQFHLPPSFLSVFSNSLFYVLYFGLPVGYHLSLRLALIVLISKQ